MTRTRRTRVARDVKAGCYVCHGGECFWYGPNAQGVAARHHDATNHATFVEVFMHITYGTTEAEGTLDTKGATG
jgi:cytochrome c551/c552